MKSAGITCRIPVADQLPLFYKFLPGERLDVTNRNWLQKTTQDGLAEGLFGVSADVGSKIGFFIGWIDPFVKHADLQGAISASRFPVLYHMFLANQQLKGSKTRSPHVLITGDTGTGKSFLAKLLFIYVSMLNVKSLYIDPKKELRKWIEKVKQNPRYNKSTRYLHSISKNSILQRLMQRMKTIGGRLIQSCFCHQCKQRKWCK